MTKLYFSNVHIALEDDIITNSSLTVDENGRISAIGSDAPNHCQEIDAKGGFIGSWGRRCSL